MENILFKYKHKIHSHSDSKVEYLQAEERQQVGRLAAGRAVDQHESDGQCAHCNQRTHIHIIYTQLQRVNATDFVFPIYYLLYLFAHEYSIYFLTPKVKKKEKILFKLSNIIHESCLGRETEIKIIL